MIIHISRQRKFSSFMSMPRSISTKQDEEKLNREKSIFSKETWVAGGPTTTVLEMKQNVKDIIPIKRYQDLNNSLVKSLISKENRNMSGIYRWKNLINGKTYLGSSVNLSKRFVKYYDDAALAKNNMLINKAIIKYGRDKFSLDIMEYCLIKDLIKREQYYIDVLRPEYNILKIAGSSYGYKHSEANLIKLRTRVITKKTLDKMRTRIQSKDTRIKISTALGISVVVTDIAKENITKYNSKTQVAKILGVSEFTIRRYIKLKKPLFNRYLITELK